MTFRTLALAGLSTLALTTAALAEITVDDPYARSSGAMATSGAAFMDIVNSGTEDDRLVGVRSDAAKKVELHTHIAGDDGVMKMRAVEDGFAIPAGGHHGLARGGDHVMFMGLNEKFTDGMMIPLTLVFEKAGEITIEVPVDQERQDAEMDHSKMKMGN